jgi:2-amino-4-hydroxy-6-hydroxymethyldihydropteridine diphosphokinase
MAGVTVGPEGVDCYVGIGSNIDAEPNIRRAVGLLARTAAVRVTAISTFYRTAAEEAPGSPDFHNGVVALRTGLSPRELRRVLEEVETACGRRRTADRNAPRTIDLDLLLYADAEESTPGLRLPHPDVMGRAYVALPLLELAPDLVLPGDRGSLRDIAARFDASIGESLPDFSADLRVRLGDAGPFEADPGGPD